MAVRQLENKRNGSNFSEWYRANMPGDRTMTDVDSIEVTMFGMRLVEQRAANYKAPKPDNAMLTLQRFARCIDWPLAVVDRLSAGMPNLQHSLYVVDQSSRLAVFAVDGNRSDLRGDVDLTVPTDVWSAVCAASISAGVVTLRISVDRTGQPVDAEARAKLALGVWRERPQPAMPRAVPTSMVRTCGLGACDSSKERGGPGCHLCDTIAKLPQQRRKQRAAGGDDE